MDCKREGKEEREGDTATTAVAKEGNTWLLGYLGNFHQRAVSLDLREREAQKKKKSLNPCLNLGKESGGFNTSQQGQ